jgi:NADP-dependent 3-hydroxy acid dehydrogenase YdfG
MSQRVAVVTGATSGIGAAITRLLGASGFRVLASGRREERLKAMTDKCDAVCGVAGDVTRDGLMGDLFAAAVRHWGRPPDAAILCAGHGLPGTLLTSDERRWRELVEVNYLAIAHQLRDCVASFLRDAAERPDTPVQDVVVIGSTIGRHVSPFNPIYGSTKFAVHSLVEALRQEVCGHNVRVTLVEPGFVKTEFQAVAGYDADWFRALEAECGPFLLAEDVARTVEFVLRQPPHVHLDDIRIRPTRQRV